MKRRLGKQLISILLAVVLCAQLLPLAAMAALLDNDPAYNQQILAALEEIVGSEDEAARYYALLQQYGLLDEDGNMPESWEIWMDGEQITLEELRALLDSGDYDPDHYILVDNTPITLGNIQTILEIEEYLAYLQETYFDGHQWTAEQTASLQSLMDQINSEGIQLLDAGVDASGTVWPSGVSHNARVAVTGPTVSGSTATFTANLTGAAEGQEVTFDWAAVSGSQPVSGSGKVTLTAGANGTASATMEVTLGTVSTSGSSPVRSTGNLVFYLNLSNLKNALFPNEKTAMSVQGSVKGNISEADLPAVPTGQDTNWKHIKNISSDGWTTTDGDFIYTLNDTEKTAIAWGMADKLMFDYFFILKNGYILAIYNSNYLKAGDDVSSISGTYNNVKVYSYEGYVTLGDVKFNWGGLKFNSMIDWRSGYTHDIRPSFDIDPEKLNLDTLSGGTFKITRTTYDGTLEATPSSNIFQFTPNTTRIAYTYGTPEIYFMDGSAASVTKITAPSADYYPGQVVPVTITFSEPVDASTAWVKFANDGSTVYSAVTSGYSNVLTFLYEVQDLDEAELSISSIHTVDKVEFEMTDNERRTVPGAALVTPNKADAVTGFEAEIESAGRPTLVTTVSIINDGDYTQWMGNDFTANDDGTFTSNSLFVSIDGEDFYPLISADGEVTGGTMTASIPLALNIGNADISHMVVLYLYDANADEYSVLIGKYDTVTQVPAVFIEEMDAPALSVLDSTGEAEYAYIVEDGKSIIYPQDSPQITAAFTAPTDQTYSFGDASRVTTYQLDAETGGYAVDGDGNYILTDPAAHFVWSSSDPGVANISADGSITPTGKAGDVSFTITALNGGVVVDGVSKAVSAESETLHFGTGLTPFLLIPNNKLSSIAGQDVTVFWTSNLCDKNGENETTFHVTVTTDGETVYTTPVTGTASAPAASVLVPGRVLEYNYDTNASNVYTVTVSATYNNVPYSASATIDLVSQPAVVNFEKLNTYYITDTKGTVDIGWKIQNFDRYSDDEASNLFKLLITRDGKEVHQTTYPGEGEGAFSGSYSLRIDDVKATASDPTSYRAVYTVTIQAKNGSDSTWSYDSFMLYVYDEDALKIWVDGKETNSVTMSNVSEISKMSQDQILALKRDIYLKNIISVNYGEYAWNEIADQIAWKSSDNDVATINYQQGTLYENIENFTYVSYRPTTEFGLSGISDGTSTVTATHKLTDLTEQLTVEVETLKDKLYLFQCYPQTTTTLRYQDSTGVWKTATSDNTGAAAIYEENGIHSDVYCSATVDGVAYLGTFYLSSLSTGEGDWTQLERYPSNNLTLRRAAYAYLYVKNPDGTPYTGSITFRGGVYVNDEYKENAKFVLNDEGVFDGTPGNADHTVTLDSDGKLTVIMNQAEWDLSGDAVSASDDVSYVFEISQGNDQTDYYPMFLTVDANVNEDAFVGTGEAIVNFRENGGNGVHPFIAAQGVRYAGYGTLLNLLDETGKIGPSDQRTEAALSTTVMWWGVEGENLSDPALRVVTESNLPVADIAGQYEVNQVTYPFASWTITQYTIKLNQTTMDAIALGTGQSTNLYLNYYADGETLSRHEVLPFKLCNMLGSTVERNATIQTMLSNMGKATGTNAGSAQGMDFGDQFLGIALNLVASDDYSTENDKLLNIQLAPTSDPTKFLGFISVKVGSLDSEDITEDYGFSSAEEAEFEYTPGMAEMMVMAGRKTIFDYASDQKEAYEDALAGKGDKEIGGSFSGYAESLIYYNEVNGKWEIQILNGGFTAGGKLSYTWNWNTMCGPVPFTATLTIGGEVSISMDVLSVSYLDKTDNSGGIGNDFLTELRIYLYLRFFAGVGIDYAVVAFKLGIYGQINATMQFQWLNRPYMYNSGGTIVNTADGGTDGTLNGQHFQIDGEIGLQFVVRILFISYEKVLFSYTFNLLNKSTNDWDEIQTDWSKNQAAQQAAISKLLGTNSLSVTSVGGQQVMTLNLAPTVESRDYLEDGRVWGDFSIGLFSLDQQSALKNLQYNSYPYANPVISDDGQLVAYLSDMDSDDVTDTRVAYAVRGADGFFSNADYADKGAIDNDGYGDSQVSLSGTKQFAVAAWTRQMQSINKDAGATLTDEDQLIMMNSSEIYAGVYTDEGGWTTTRLTDNSFADLAPVVATNGSRAIVAWRSVASSGESVTDEDGNSYAGVTNFDERDNILYRIYNGSEWGETQTLYNGTSGAVKGITAAMLNDGTAAVAYTLDSDKSDGTIYDRDVYYAVIGSEEGEVTRNVRATNDAYLDENPQLTAVTFPSADDAERFVLGWYAEQAVSSDGADTLDAGTNATGNETTSDIRLLDFDGSGTYTQLLPDSISQVADAYGVSITPTFRFTKNSDSINDLSILWVERAETISEDVDVEKDVLKGVKFYTYGQNDEIISFTGAIDVAEMDRGTLIDHFDAYVSDPDANEIKAVILGTTYGADGVITKTSETVNGETVSYSVPSRTTSMYTATETYGDKISVPALLAEYKTVKKGATTQIQFTIENNGIHAINKLQIDVGDTTTVYDSLNLLPGASIQLWADYKVPENDVVDPEYTVTATFDEDLGATGSAEIGGSNGFLGLGAKPGSNVVTGIVYLDLPDVEITDAKIVEEVDGGRTIQIKLNNDSDATLTKSGRSVKISFYTDSTCETPIEGLDPITVSGSHDLTMLDEGGYSIQTTFDINRYLEVISTQDNTLTEIPESGIKIFMKAEVLEDGEVLPEPIYSNNYATVTCENLKVRTGNDVSVTSDFALDNGSTVVTAYLQNNRLSQTTTGNVIVALLDANNNVIAQQQSYTGDESNNGLITVEGEDKDSVTFTFDNVTNAVSAQVVYSDLIIGGDNANLTNLTFSNTNVTLDSFKKDEDGNYRAVVSTDDLTFTTVTAAAESNLAKITLDDGDEAGNAVNHTVELVPGEINTITVTVTNGSASEIYILTIQNNGEPVITIDQDAETGYSASVVYNGDKTATVSLTAAAKPETPGYKMTYQWYSCDASGTVLSEIPASISEDTASAELSISSTIDAGVHYYICEVTREMLDHSTKTYKSSVASVEITKAEGNSVTVTGLTADYDNLAHQFPAAAADKSGSTIYYSTDYGTAAAPTWSVDAPSFTEVGVHTVWVYATNNNYEDTEIKTADVLIQGEPAISEPTVTINEGFGTSVVYASDSSAAISITATQNPIEAEYQLSYQWYECDVTGQENRTELAGETGSTLTVPSTVGAGVHYYICKITRQMVDGSTTDYWSSAASVEITKATDNSVMWDPTTITFDNQPHSLNNPAAAKEGSTLHYSTDGGKTWSETVPAFTSVGVHTIWIYATNPNYEDTAVVTADVVIQEREGTQFKLETNSIEKVFDSYPAVIKEKYADASAMETALKAEVVKLGASKDNAEVYDIKLLFSLDGGVTWTEATAENFPAAGITVTLKYPEGINRYNYNFILRHLIVNPLNTGKRAGELEKMDFTLTEEGIRFTADCLSPFVLGWYLRSSSGSGSVVNTIYKVAVEDSEHGTVTVNPAQAANGTTVTVTAKPDEGYEVDSVTVTTQNGRELTVTDKGNNTYTFRMPTGSVNVKVSFIKSREAVVNPFTDVSSSAYYYDAMLWAVENGVTAGTSATTFSPDMACTRAQAVTFLWRAAGSPAPRSANNPFTDVSAGTYYYDAVLWAVENGVTVGTSATTFSPDLTCTRAQIATFLWRATGSTVETASNPFTDVSAGTYYYDAVLWAVKHEVTDGTSTTTFSPDQNCTRAQIVTFLYRAKED